MDELKKELKELPVALEIIREIGEEFDIMIKGFDEKREKAHFLRMELAVIWFNQFIFTKEDKETENTDYRRKARLYTKDGHNRTQRRNQTIA